MSELTDGLIFTDIETDFDDPSDHLPEPEYSDLGHVIFSFYELTEPGDERRAFEVDVEDHTPDTSLQWLDMGIGIEYWIKYDLDLKDLKPDTRYLIANIHGRYMRGDWGFTEDDEEWYWSDPIEWSGELPAGKEEFKHESMKASPAAIDIAASVAATLKTTEANNATFIYRIYQASLNNSLGPYLEVYNTYLAQPNYEEINKNGTYQQRCQLAEAVVAILRGE